MPFEPRVTILCTVNEEWSGWGKHPITPSFIGAFLISHHPQTHPDLQQRRVQRFVLSTEQFYP
jgi:hypothetical protein